MSTFSPPLPAASKVHFDMDDYLNRICFSSQVHKFPTPIARFLGWRKQPAKPIGNILVAFWAFIGAFLGLILVGATFRYSPLIREYHTPVLFASLGATAVLNYNTVASPLAQPRASILGQGISALIGVGIAKLFELSPEYTDLRWIVGPLACGLASSMMTMTNTIHPPGGATALLAVIDPTIQRMGWIFVPLILLGTVLMFLVALVVNNLQRQFPVFWWTPGGVGRPQSKHDVENGRQTKEQEGCRDGKIEQIESAGFRQMIVLSASGVIIPEGFALDPEQVQVLELLRDKLRDWNVNDEVEKEGEGSFGSESDITHVESRTVR